jgi:hypothetical protein
MHELIDKEKKKEMEKKMKLSLIVKTLFLLSTVINAKTYINDRFNFSIDYPESIFVNMTYPQNGDGVWLRSKDNRVTLTPSGSLAVVSKNIKEAYNQILKWKAEDKNIEVTYKVQKKNWFVISGFNHEKKTLFYEKKFYYDEMLVGYLFEYPTELRKKYDSYIETFNKSFSYGNNFSELETNEIKKSNKSYQVYQELNKYDIFFMLVKSSEYIKSWSNSTNLKYFHLFEENADDKFDKVWTNIIDTYLFDKKREYLFIKEKSALYKKPNLKSKSKKFLIKNDCAMIIDKTKSGWYKVFYYHPHWKNQYYYVDKV